MSSNLTRCTQDSLWVSKTWLEEKATDKNAYLDIDELKRKTGHYYDWYKAKHGTSKAEREAYKAGAMTVTGLRVNDASNYWIDCTMWSDTEHHRRYFAPGVTHPNAFKRIYAHGTTARGVEIVGISGAV